MRRTAVLLSALFGSLAFSQETIIKVRVEEEGGKEAILPVEVKRRTPKTETTVKEEELKVRSGAGGVNIFKAIELTPSLNAQTDDAYGLGGGSIRLRGFDNTQIGVTIDDMPLNDSGNFALYPHEYADVENLESITVERGAVSKRSPFYVEIGGAIRVRTRPPANKFGITLSEKYGSFSFKKHFIRIDTGYLLGNKDLPKLFVSYSHTEADKWKGPGKYPDYRDHYTVGISHKVGRLFWEFYYDKNVQLNYFYRGFSFSELSNDSIFRRRDYNDRLLLPNTGTNLSQNVYYYKFWKNPYTNQQLRANIELDITNSVKLSLKPYMWIGRGSGTSATSSGGNILFRESFNYTDRPGAIAELKFELPKDSRLFLGYWYEYADLKQWQPSRRVIVNPDGTLSLTGFQYNYIQRTKTITNTPYLFFESKGLLDRLDINLGVRFASVTRNFKNYRTTGLPYYPEDGVYDDPRLTLDTKGTYEKTYRKTLPSFGVGYQFTNFAYGYFAYAKNFRVPQNFLGTIPASVTAQFVADQLKPEEADNYDLGLRFDFDKFYIAPSVYYVKYKNRLIRIADPNNPNLIYLRNAGKVDAYGAELELGFVPVSSVSIYTSFSYNEAKFKDESFYDGSTKYNIKDKTVPDTPKYMVKLGGRFQVMGFRISPSVQYIGSRYGNLINTEKVSSYTLVNLNVQRKVYKGIDLFVDVVNLTDKKYVGRISPGTTSGTYYAGAPFTISVGLSGRF
ncbi:TonB-dependent receptor [Thermocrinis sp.]|jgi:iron complex outermembrane receptor protein|uniref:TonB-dependent receptor n=1 Tax=Thermocrinis sp. TaxID=2024383 RepID=UPI0026069391|nr:TonB-dependent receptor [Thermocrinis sp.]